TYLLRLRRFYAKHRETVERHGLELLQGKEAFLQSQREYRQTLERRVALLEGQLEQLRREIAETVEALEKRGLSRVEWGDLQRAQPLSLRWGMDRGRAIDRYNIEGFLDLHRADI